MSAKRIEETDKVAGLDLGADEYLIKPFGSRELLARVNVILRRQRQCSGRSAVCAVQLEIDSGSRSVLVRGTPIELTAKEFSLLEYLSKHSGQVVSRDAILKDVWGYEPTAYSRTIDTHIFTLRRKVEEDPAHPRIIRSERGGGYRFVS